MNIDKIEYYSVFPVFSLTISHSSAIICESKRLETVYDKEV